MSSETSWVESMPDLYDAHLGPALFEPFGLHLAALAAALSPGTVLELAAGTGITTRALVAALPGAAVTATDLNPPMVAWAAEHVPGATWQVADAQRLDFPDGAFDLVVCAFGVMFFPDRPAAFAEAARVLAPGGTMLFAVWDVVTASPFPTAMINSLHAVLPDATPTFIVRVPHGYHSPEQIRADVAAGGLVVDALEHVVLPGRASSARALAEGFGLGSPLRFALAERGQLEPLVTALGEEMTRRLGDSPLEADNAAIVVTAHCP